MLPRKTSPEAAVKSTVPHHRWYIITQKVDSKVESDWNEMEGRKSEALHEIAPVSSKAKVRVLKRALPRDQTIRIR